MHDTNLSNTLRFLGFWKRNDIRDHFVTFSSSLRFELIAEKGKGRYYMRAVFDGMEFLMDGCDGKMYCPLTNWLNLMYNNLNMEHESREAICSGASDFANLQTELKYN